MSERAPYSRVYWSIVDDPKFDGIREDVRYLGAWIKLLLLADMAYPAAGYVPRGVTSGMVKKLADAGLIDVLPHDRFRLHGLEAERERRSKSASQNASLRWERPPVVGGRPTSRRTRFKVLERDNYRCRYCGRGTDVVALDVDHIIPIREGGTDDVDNLVAACVDCNGGKSGHPLRAQPLDHARALLDKTSKDKPHLDEQNGRARGQEWDDPEHPAAVWLAEHGCALTPHSGYYRQLVTMVEAHGLTAVVGMFDRLAAAGTKTGDVKGYLFGAKDALDAKTRPNLAVLARQERAAEAEREQQEATAKTRRYLDDEYARRERLGPGEAS